MQLRIYIQLVDLHVELEGTRIGRLRVLNNVCEVIVKLQTEQDESSHFLYLLLLRIKFILFIK